MAQEGTKAREQDFEEFAALGEEFAGYVGVMNLEQETKAKISQYVHDVQSELSKDVVIDARSLSKWFPKAESATLKEGVMLTLKEGKKTTTVSLLEMEPEPYYAVVKQVGVAVASMLAEAGAKLEEEAKPALQAFTRLTGRKLGVFDWRNYELILANTGGKAVGMTVSISEVGSWSYGPIDIGSMETTEIDLHNFSKIERSKNLKVELRCEDAEGRAYTGRVELEPNSKSVRIFVLEPAKAEA